jgi:hypothetical protein
MAISKRYLNLFRLGLAGALIVVVARAQSAGAPAEPPPVKFRTLAVGNPVPLAGLFYEVNRKSVPLLVNDTDLSMPYDAPRQGALSIYREAPPVPPETKPRRITVAEVNLGKDPAYLVVLTAKSTTTVSAAVISDSWEAHPFETVMVLNFSKRRVAVKAGDKLVELSPSGSHVFPYPPGDSEILTLQTATNDAGGWVLRMNSPQGIIHGTRASIVISDVEPSQWDPHPEGINVINMIDTTPQPKPDGLSQRQNKPTKAISSPRPNLVTASSP